MIHSCQTGWSRRRTISSSTEEAAMERMSETMRDLGYGDQERRYHLTHSELSKKQNRPGEKRLPDVPLIEPQRKPDEIMGKDHDFIKKHLIGHKKSRMEWADYREKNLDPGEQEILSEVLGECRVNGFVNPHIVNDRVVFAQIIKAVIRYKDRTFYKKYQWPLTVADMRARSNAADWYGGA
jgi:hypothetical protein